MLTSVLLALAMRTIAPTPVHNWESDIVYHIFPRSYRDSNGDGHGDFNGITEGLDNIVKLGCTAILLNPIYKSRVYHDYFADDWFDVDPRFGTLDDFRRLVKEAHARHLRIILDMEPQYVAAGHPWYQAAMKNPNSKEADYLVKPLEPRAPHWYDKAPVPIASVNLNAPFVKETIHRNFRFWAELGVDGFRIDHMMDDLDYRGQNTNLYAGLWDPIEKEIKRDFPGTFFVGEQADWGSMSMKSDIFRHTDTDAVFNFDLRDALVMQRKTFLENHIAAYGITPPGREQVNFLENHDMVRYASEETDPARQRLAAALLFSLKGIPSVYYGQEIGMRGRQGKWGSDGNDIPIRLGYRWGATLNSPGTPLWYKDTGPWWSKQFSSDHDGRSLAEQDKDPKSLLNWYRRLIEIRKSSPALSTGSQTLMAIPNDDVVGVVRVEGGDSVAVIANLGRRRRSLAKGIEWNSVDLLTGQKFAKEQSVALSPLQLRLLQKR